MGTESIVLFGVDSNVGFSEALVENGVVKSLPARSFRAPAVRVRILADGTWGPHSQVPQCSFGQPADVAPLRSGDLEDPEWRRYLQSHRNESKIFVMRSRADFCIPAFGPWPENLYHWTIEILPRIYFALQVIPKGASVEIVIPVAATRDSSFREMLDSIVDCPVTIRSTSRTVRFRRAVVADTVVCSAPTGPSKGRQATRNTVIHPPAFLEFARNVQEGLKSRARNSKQQQQQQQQQDRTGQQTEIMFLDRGPSARRPYNREEVLRHVQALGARIVRPHEVKKIDLQKLLSTAKIVIAPHGAGITNVVLCQNMSKLVVLIPATHVRQRALWTNLAGSLGATTIFVVGACPDSYSDSDRRTHAYDVADISAAFRHGLT